MKCAADVDRTLADAVNATLDEPPLVVLRVRPAVAARLAALEAALAGPGRPASVLSARVAANEIVVELVPRGRALVLLLAVIDAVLVATPGRTIVPVLPFSDDVLAEFAALRLGDAELTVSRVLEPYVEELLEVSGA